MIKKDEVAYCISELPGYTTVGKGYVINQILESVDRVSITDDNGKEAHVSMKRFVDFEEYKKFKNTQAVILTRSKIIAAWERTKSSGMNSNPVLTYFLEELGLD